jgi:hypothetical protein
MQRHATREPRHHDSPPPAPLAVPVPAPASVAAGGPGHSFADIAVTAEDPQEAHQRRSVPVQRDALQLKPPSLIAPADPAARYRLGGDLQLQLDPQIEAMMQQQLQPAAVLPSLAQINLNLPATGAATPSSGGAGSGAFASPPPPPAPTGAAAPSATPAPANTESKEEKPKNASASDVLKAVAAMPEVKIAWENLQTQVVSQVKIDWGKLKTGEKIGAISTVSVIALGGIAGAATDPAARQLMFDQLNGKTIPVPGLNWLTVETNIAGPNLMFGLHVDVGRFLPSVLNFGPGSPSAIGGPPQPEPLPGQRRAAADATPGNDAQIGERIRAAAGRGASLAPDTQQWLESGLGADLSPVRLHTDSDADDLSRSLGATAFTTGPDIFFRAGAYAPASPDGQRLLAHEATHVVQQAAGPVAGTPGASGIALSDPGDSYEQAAERTAAQLTGMAASPGAAALPHTTPASRAMPSSLMAQRKGDGGAALPPGATDVGIKGGESKTPSDQTVLATGYTERPDGQYDTPYGRTVTKEQALAESKVLNSEGIFMGAYLARYNAVGASLPAAELDKLSRDAGFMKQFKTGDVVLRMMDASDSAGIAKITDSNYSHSGIIQVKDGRVWVLDSYPRSGDSTVLIRFEEFFADHAGEKIIRGVVLTITGLSDGIRNAINDIIKKYDAAETTFDRSFKIDDSQYVLYCSELVWRVLKEAGAPNLPPNEFEFTKNRVNELIGLLEGVIAFRRASDPKANTADDEKNLATLRSFAILFRTEPNPEMYSPGSLERNPGMTSMTGFNRAGEIEGSFNVIVVKGTVPDDWWDKPDALVTSGSSKTSVKDDTMTPTWNETLVSSARYDALEHVTFKLFDYDPISANDLLATFEIDLRPVKPAGQTFELADSGATLTVKVEGENEGKDKGAFGPQTLPG